jgi:type I restriction enzyme S subunit
MRPTAIEPRTFTRPRPHTGFAVRRRELTDRADVNFARLKPTVDDVKARSRYELVPLDRIVARVQYGDSSKSIEEDNGAPILRMTNLQDGDWDLTDVKYTTLDDAARSTFRLEKGDVLFNRTNSKELVGKCAVFGEDDDWYFASYLIRVQVSDIDYRSEFLARFLNSDVGRVQIDQISRQIIGMANINAEEIRALWVPKPPPDIQDAMVLALRGHWEGRQTKLAEVRELLATGSREIAERLELHPPKATGRIAHAATRADMRSCDRLNPEFFHPERIFSIRAIEESPTPSMPLSEIAHFVRDLMPTTDDHDVYIGLANVERDTGELVNTGLQERPAGACVRFQAGDVLYAKLRPYLNKVHLAEHNGVASPEFLVLRAKEGIRAEYLTTILRSEIVLAQSRHMTAGNTHPRLTSSDVENMYLPLPDPLTQDKVADLDAVARTKARALKVEADRAWMDAKQRFGDDLID